MTRGAAVFLLDGLVEATKATTVPLMDALELVYAVAVPLPVVHHAEPLSNSQTGDGGDGGRGCAPHEGMTCGTTYPHPG